MAIDVHFDLLSAPPFGLSWTQVVYGIPPALIALLGLRIVYSLYFHPLAAYPGPLLARLGVPFLSWAQIQGAKNRTLWSLDEVHNQYGDWVRIGYNELSTLEPAALPVLYSPSTKWRKSGFYETFKAPKAGHNLFSATDPHEHSLLRRINASAYTMTTLLRLESNVQKQAQVFIDLVEQRYAATGRTLDIGKVLQYLAADVVGSLAFGNDDGFELMKQNDDPQGFLDAVIGTNKGGFIFGSFEAWGSSIFHFLAFVGGTPPGIRRVLNFAEANIAARRKRVDSEKSQGADMTDYHDMLTSFMKAKDPATGKQLDQDRVMLCSMAVLVAGSDTTSSTMRALLMYTMTTPGVMDKLLAEIDEAFDNGSLSWPPTYAEATKLEYFQACLKEALRMWPAVAWILARKAPPGGGVIGDRRFPAGTIVGVSAHHFHRRAADAFGPEPEKYKPERWLQGGEEDRKRREANFLAFGGGTRICIGRNISILEISIALPMLLRNYSMSLVPAPKQDAAADHPRSFGYGAEQHTWKVDSCWFALQSEMYVEVKRRSQAHYF